MSFGNTTTRIIDPVVQTSRRCEFRLVQDSAYLSNMRLLGVGATTSQAGDVAYNALVGALGVIKSIALFDGSQLLEQLNNAQILLAYKANHSRNDENISLARKLNVNNQGYVASGKYLIAANQFQFTNIKVKPDIANSNDKTKTSHVSLRDLFSFLRESMVLPTNVFRQLRLVIEYQDTAFIKQNVWYKNDGTNELPSQDALLVVEEVNDGEVKDKIMSDYQGVSFTPLETDQLLLPATANGVDSVSGSQVEQNKSFLAHGFNNKYLNRLLLWKQPTDASTFQNGADNSGYMGFASIPNWRESFQCRVNGGNVLAGNGIAGSSSGLTPTANNSQGGSSKNRALRKLTDAWGTFNVVPAQNFVNTTDRTKQTDMHGMGQLSVVGLRVDQMVQELQIQYGRFGVYNNAGTNTNKIQTQAENLVLVGEVRKAVIMNSDGTYNVVYN